MLRRSECSERLQLLVRCHLLSACRLITHRSNTLYPVRGSVNPDSIYEVMREGKNGQTLRKEFDVATVTPGLVAWHPARRRIKTVVLKRLLVAAWHYENLEGL